MWWHALPVAWLLSSSLGLAAQDAQPAPAPAASASPSAAPSPAGDAPTVARARTLLQQGDAAGAEAILARVVQAQPDDFTAWMLLGFARHTQGAWESALAAHVRAAELDPSRSTPAYNAACASARLLRTDDAFRWLAVARAAGFADRGTMLGDADLSSLRADARFPALVPPLRTGAELFVEPVRILLALDGEAAGDQFGWVARNVGDLDGDGGDDFVVTAPTRSSPTGGANAGRIYAYGARSGALLFTADGDAGERFGNIVAPLGDVDGDGVRDILVGAPGSPPGAGHAYVLSGRDGARLRSFHGGEAGDSFGLKAAGLPDMDGDGLPDVAIGAPGAAAGAGRVTIHSSADGRVLHTLDGEPGAGLGSSLASWVGGPERLLVVGASTGGANGTGQVRVARLVDGAVVPHFTFEGGATAKQLGQYFVSVLGDVDGDDVPDVYGSDWNDAARGPHTGTVYVHSGRSGARLLQLTGSAPGEGFGTSPSEAGDVDGDGRADLVVGSWRNAEGAPAAGKATVFSGRDGSVLASYTSREAGDTFGFDATGLGDVDGDGAPDFLITAAWSAVHGPQTGRVFVLAGPSRPAPADEAPAR